MDSKEVNQKVEQFSIIEHNIRNIQKEEKRTGSNGTSYPPSIVALVPYLNYFNGSKLLNQ